MIRIRSLLTCQIVVGMALVRLAAVDGAERSTFERDVRPILKAYCLDCHGAGEKNEGNLDLRLKRFAERGGDSGPAGLISGDAENSLILHRLKAGEMPPGEKKLSADQMSVIELWIRSGAATDREEPSELPTGVDITPQERAFWFFQPIRRVDPPTFQGADGVRTTIDAFILQRLREEGFSFSPEADKSTLIRRAAYDLTGLPPTQDQIDGYLADSGPQAFEDMIDRLLDSPQYGERWAQHWLDVAGYSDSDGNGNEDTPRPYSYKYRDYVIRSLNADKPLDRFIVEQLAGDELAASPWNNLQPDQIELLSATGFLRTAVDDTARMQDVTMAANQVVADTLKIVSSSLLGLSVGCAQCHDHRYDPIPQSDYYRLRAIFEPALDPSHWRGPRQRLVSLYTDADRAKADAVEAEARQLQTEMESKRSKYIAAALEKELEKFPEEQRAALRDTHNTPADQRTEEQKKLLAANPSVNITPGVLYQYDQPAADELTKDQEKINAKRSEKPVEDFISVLSEVPETVPATHVFHRGDARQPKQAVTPGDLTIAAPEGARYEIPEKDPQRPTTGRRLAWAQHLTIGQHPLTTRVLANRIWFHHFDRGLVDTPGDFGALGGRPSHPELLDWLASELVRQGWSLKKMHRLIMTSAVYRQSSQRDPAKDRVDSDNHLYGRHPVRRADAESLRDRILSISGRLDLTPFGPPVPVMEDFVGQVVVKDDAPRRSIYLQARRTRPVSFLTAFDAPVMAVNCDRRTLSTAAPQSLMLMNGDFVLRQAELVAQRVQRDAPATAAMDFSPQIARAWQIVYSRAPSMEELGLAGDFLARQTELLGTAGKTNDPQLAVLTNLCQQLISSNEFLYVD